MAITRMDSYHQQLKKLAKSHGFITKRNSCFRIKGDGILQILKFEYEPWLSQYELRIGLYSLYSFLQPHWLTPSGCILRYPVMACTQMYQDVSYSPEQQLHALQEFGFAWLDAMHTQSDLVDAMCEIEIRIHGKIQWIDSFKLAPYLSSGNYHAAERILSSILQQHLGPDVWTTNPWTEIDYEIYRLRYPGKDEHLLLIYDWIHNKDISAIQSYLSDNFVVNSSSNKLT